MISQAASTMSLSTPPNPTNLNGAFPPLSSAGTDSSTIQNIAFGIFMALVGVVGTVIAYFQLIHMRKPQLRDMESGSDIVQALG